MAHPVLFPQMFAQSDLAAVSNAYLLHPMYFANQKVLSPDPCTTSNTPCQLVAMSSVTYHHIQIPQNDAQAPKLIIIWVIVTIPNVCDCSQRITKCYNWQLFRAITILRVIKSSLLIQLNIGAAEEG